MDIPPWRFWDLTYRELAAHMEGAAIKARVVGKNSLWAAWQTANFTRAKKLPVLGPLLRKLDPRPAVMDNKSLRAALVGAAMAMGSKVVYRKKATPPAGD